LPFISNQGKAYGFGVVDGIFFNTCPPFTAAFCGQYCCSFNKSKFPGKTVIAFKSFEVSIYLSALCKPFFDIFLLTSQEARGYEG
jgi:hypothetical protein